MAFNKYGEFTSDGEFSEEKVSGDSREIKDMDFSEMIEESNKEFLEKLAEDNELFEELYQAEVGASDAFAFTLEEDAFSIDDLKVNDFNSSDIFSDNDTTSDIKEEAASEEYHFERPLMDSEIFDSDSAEEPNWSKIAAEAYPEVNTVHTDVVMDHTNIEDWIHEINPNFDPYDYTSPYCNNCGSCAYNLYRRLEYGDTGAVASAVNIGYNDEMEALTGMEQVPMSPSEIEARLLAQGDGAHAIIGIDRAEGPGHWFNAICRDGKVYCVDGQSGTVTDWPPDYGNVVNWEMSVKRGDW